MSQVSSSERITYFNNLRTFIKENSEKVEAFCGSLSWCPFTGITNELLDFCECPYNSGHRVPKTSFTKHIEKCQFAEHGYIKEDKPFPPPYIDGGPTIILSQLDHCNIIQAASATNPSIPTVSLADVPAVPQSASQLLSSFTSQQRLALYEYVAKETAHKRPGNLTLTEADLAFDTKPAKPENPKSFLEILAEQRDSKRRRLNYRQAKKVHTKHKSQTEVTREVIENQMELYMEWLQQNSNGAGSKSRRVDNPKKMEVSADLRREIEDKHSFYTTAGDEKSYERTGRDQERGHSESEFRQNMKQSSFDRHVSYDKQTHSSYKSHNHRHEKTHRKSYDRHHKKSYDRHISSEDYYDSDRDTKRKHRDKYYRDYSLHSDTDDKYRRKKYKH